LRATASTLNVLAIGDGPASASLAAIARASGGFVLSEADPARWSQAAMQLLRAAQPSHLEPSPARGTFAGVLASLGRIEASPWNRTWARSEATVVAANESGGEPLAAYWSAGSGRVVAYAFAAAPAIVEQTAGMLARPPRDERFAVRWIDDAGGSRVVVDAIESGQSMNGVSLSLGIGEQSRPLEQTGPGRYEAWIEPSQAPAIAVVAHAGQVIDRRALAARYAPEFAAIGNDYTAMRELAARTGGAVVNPAMKGPLVLPRETRAVALTPWLAMLAGAMIAATLVAWRITKQG
jgi:hypothetical protein